MTRFLFTAGLIFGPYALLYKLLALWERRMGYRR